MDNVFLAYFWQYLQYMIIPGNVAADFTPNYADLPYRPNKSDPAYTETIELAREIADDYLPFQHEPIEEQWLKAGETADEIRNAVSFLDSSFYTPTPISNLPILLMTRLGLVTVMFESVLSQSPSLYPNEWNALIQIGYSLCQFSAPDSRNVQHSYFWWLVNNIPKDRYVDYTVDVSTPALPGYTAEAISLNIQGCTEQLDIREIKYELRRVKNGIRKEAERIERLTNTNEVELDQRTLEYNRRLENVAAVEDALNNIGKRTSLSGTAFTQLLELRDSMERSDRDGPILVQIGQELGLPLDADQRNALLEDPTYRDEYLAYLLDYVQTI